MRGGNANWLLGTEPLLLYIRRFYMALDDKFNQIYELYYKLMYKVSYSILQNFEDTEDVLQEAFIRIDKNISKHFKRVADFTCKIRQSFYLINFLI